MNGKNNVRALQISYNPGKNSWNYLGLLKKKSQDTMTLIFIFGGQKALDSLCGKGLVSCPDKWTGSIDF